MQLRLILDPMPAVEIHVFFFFPETTELNLTTVGRNVRQILSLPDMILIENSSWAQGQIMRSDRSKF